MTAALLFRIANALLLLVFTFGVVVQFNDPDPWGWAAVYALAAVVCVQALRGGRFWPLPALVASGALVWAASIAPRVLGRVRIGELFEEFEMKSPLVEEAREMYGLLIIAVWMIVLVLAARRVSSAGASR